MKIEFVSLVQKIFRKLRHALTVLISVLYKEDIGKNSQHLASLETFFYMFQVTERLLTMGVIVSFD